MVVCAGTSGGGGRTQCTSVTVGRAPAPYTEALPVQVATMGEEVGGGGRDGGVGAEEMVYSNGSSSRWRGRTKALRSTTGCRRSVCRASCKLRGWRARAGGRE